MQETNVTTRPYLSIDEVSDRWGVSRGTVYNAISDGRLRAKRFGKHIRIHRKEIERYEAESDWENGQYRVSPMKGKKMPRAKPAS